MIYPCQEAWLNLRCIARNASVFVSVDNSTLKEAYFKVIRPTRSLVLGRDALHARIRHRVPWISESRYNMAFLPDERCCHAPYLLERRFAAIELLKTSGFAADRIIVLRPDSMVSCDTMRTFLQEPFAPPRIIHAAGYPVSPLEPQQSNTCPSNVNDQWLYGDAPSVTTLLSAFPYLKTWHREWEQSSNFDKWWQHRHRNYLRAGHFFLNTEGIYGLMMQRLGLVCKLTTLVIRNYKKC